MRGDTHDFIPIAAPSIGAEEEEAVLRVLRSGRLVQGPEVAALETRFAAVHGLKHAVAVSSGTAALHAALLAVGVGAGDEVLVPAFTFAASANAVLAAGATPVFVDIDSEFLLDLDDARRKTSPKTCAIMPVHLYGLMVDLDAFEAFAGEHGLAIIEDAAQAHLARRGGRFAGSAGVAAFSLYATKNMMSGEGGLVTTDDDAVADRLRLVRNHGMLNRYEHLEWGLNYRLSDLHAAIGRAQLDRLPAATERRRRNAETFSSGLPDFFRLPNTPTGAEHVFHQYTVRVPAPVRDEVVDRFRDRNVGVDVYYPIPLNHQKAFAHLPHHACPEAERAAQEVLSLPVHQNVDDESAAYVVEVAHSIAGDLR